MRAEERRNHKRILNAFLKSKGTSWRRYRDYLGAGHKISLSRRMKLIAHSFGISGF